MGSKKNITEDKKEEIVLLYADLRNYSAVAQRLGIAVNTVKNVWLNHDKNANQKQLVQRYAKEKKKANDNLFEIMKSTQVSTIVQKMLNIIDKEGNLEQEFDKYGIQRFTSMIGMMTDKQVGLQDLEIRKQKMVLDEKAMEIRLKELAIKEKELELRISNPDAFAEVHIINDAPKPRENNVNPN